MEIRHTPVLLVCEYATLNGGERSMLSTLPGVGEARFRPIVAAPSQGPLADAIRAQGVELVPFEPRDPAGRRRPVEQLREELAGRIRQLGPKLVHANSLATGRLLGPVAAGLGVPSVAHLRDIVKLSSAAIADLNCHKRLLAVSEATRRFHVAQGLAAEKTQVLYNGVDLQQFRPRPATGYLHRELGLPPGVPLLGAIGQISLRKGLDVLVRAAQSFCARTEARLLMVGERFSGKDESREFEAQLRRAAEGPLCGRLHLLGPRADVDRLLNELTLLVHPARQEPLGRVLLEAGAAGVAVIATDVGGTREIFLPGCEAARLTAPDDPAALAVAVEDLLSDAAARARLGVMARRRIEEAFDRRRATLALVEHYGELAEKQG